MFLSVCCMVFLVRPPPYKAETCVSMLDLRQKYKLPSDKKRERYAVSTGDIFHESQREEARPPYVIGIPHVIGISHVRGIHSNSESTS